MFHLKRNVPGRERLLRVAAGLLLAGAALSGVTFGLPSWVLLACAAGVALTGFVGFCPAYSLLGRQLPKRGT